MQILSDYPLKSAHTFSLTASARGFVELTSESQIPSLMDVIASYPRHYVLGEGSNTVFVDNFEGLVIKNALSGVKVTEDSKGHLVEVAAGENWHDLVCRLISMQINGLENLALIPGTVGAAPIQNIGAYGVEQSKFFQSARVLNLNNGKISSLSAEECQFGYRDSVFKRAESANFLILSVSYYFPKLWQPILHYGPLAEIEEPTAKIIMENVIAIRQSKLPDPHVLPNAGSFFKNPVVSDEKRKSLLEHYPELVSFPYLEGYKLAAAWLIEHAGGKNESYGDIGVHQKQALVLVNNGAGSAEQLVKLIAKIRQSVSEKFDVELVPEVQLISSTGKLSL